MKDILIVKRKRNELFNTKVTKQRRKGYSSPDYQKVLDVKNPADIAQFFSDLSLLYDAPIDKAYKEFKNKKNPVRSSTGLVA